jgi:hypothetical protein
MKAICGLVLPVAIPRKSLSVKEKVASGFPSYGPKIQNQNIHRIPIHVATTTMVQELKP